MSKIQFQWFKNDEGLTITILFSKSVCDRYGFGDGQFEFEFSDPEKLKLPLDDLCSIAAERLFDENMNDITPDLVDEFEDYLMDTSNWAEPEEVEVLEGAAVVEMFQRMGLLNNQAVAGGLEFLS
jgi:hypothetical protein